MPELKMCPLKAVATAISLSDSDGYEDTCSKEGCGWWDAEGEQCATMSIANALWMIENALNYMKPQVKQIKDCLEAAHSEDYTIGKAEDEVYEPATIPKDDEPF